MQGVPLTLPVQQQATIGRHPLSVLDLGSTPSTNGATLALCPMYAAFTNFTPTTKVAKGMACIRPDMWRSMLGSHGPFCVAERTFQRWLPGCHAFLVP